MTSYSIDNADINQWLDSYDVQVNGRFHALLLDPPYALIENSKRFSSPTATEPDGSYAGGAFKRQARGFMNQGWDGFESLTHYQLWVTEWASKLHRVMYPGAVGATFGGSRTWHRLAVGLEDAGLEIVDTIIWAYGSGMPKSLNIGRAIDKRAGFTAAKRKQLKADGTESTRRADSVAHGDYGDKSETYEAEYFTPDGQRWAGHGTLLKPAYEPIIIFRVPRGKASFIDLATTYGTGALNIDAARIPTGVNDVIPQVTQGAKDRIYGNGQGMRSESGLSNPHDAGRFPANVILTHSPDCQFIGHKTIKGDGGAEIKSNPSGDYDGVYGHVRGGITRRVQDSDGNETVEAWDCAPGCPVREINEQSGNVKAGGNLTGQEPSDPTAGIYGKYDRQPYEGYSDSGGAARFFYSGKAATWERHLPDYLSPSDDLTPAARAEALTAMHEIEPQFGSTDIFPAEWVPKALRSKMQAARCTHPTVKPIELTAYLAKLLLPPDGQERRLLIPFSGVGSEMTGACLAGWEFVQGVELTPDYIPQAESRLRWWNQYPDYESAQLAYNQKKETARESLKRVKAAEKVGLRQVPLFPEE